MRRMSSIAPLAILSAVVPMGSSDPGWTLQSGSGLRRYARDVAFERTFSAPPVVQLGVVGVDSSRDHNLRLHVRPENITANGFTIVVETDWESALYGVDASWLAIGS
jgi:hypothetical protein